MIIQTALDMATKARDIIANETERLRTQLDAVCLHIHSHPELCYEETVAHETICNFLETNGFSVTRHAYGLPTCFEAEIGTGGAAYHILRRAATELGLAGRVRLLGTPAEEGGGGKIKLLDAGAFEGAAAALMSHPTSMNRINEVEGFAGAAGVVTVAASKLTADFSGRAAHAGATPWQGIDALDAAVGSYVNISVLRQQIKPAERIHGVITNGGDVPNIIPEKTSMVYAVRSRTATECSDLVRRVKACSEASAIATDCQVKVDAPVLYADQILNPALCEDFTEEMILLGEKFLPMAKEAVSASTDMGNVSHVVPSFHCSYGICSGDASNHTAGFTAAAATPDALNRAIRVGKGLAMLGIRLLLDAEFCQSVRFAFEQAK
ncbi:hypothetical protein S7711_09831 [Stachybotrys chartarum IBT 7711]|uniref:Peptidase M20 domain-containing protein 2 n=1 Tax=Stachybotrys chartarum (strain CBS 109288 / IBT 7711) TaxID=1280523 RepID=A0A084AZT5_STACB|nr:hypothetical protein S7711_09831 [Stachybotrys chartarum IBT 7711]